MGRPSSKGTQPVPSQPTVSRIWQNYKRNHKLKAIRDKDLSDWLVVQFGQGTLDPKLPRSEIENRAVKVMVCQGLIMPSSFRFRRALGTATRKFNQEDNQHRIERIEQSLGVSLHELPVAQRWTTAQELIRYPPAQIGPANLPKMAQEYRTFRDLTAALEKNNLSPQVLIDHPDCERQFRFVERTRPSLLAKWEKNKVLEALPFYLAGRLQESIDAVLICFVRKARLLRSRVSEELEAVSYTHLTLPTKRIV